MEADYKGHHIIALAWQYTNNTWKPHVHIIDLTKGDKVFVAPLLFNQTYSTEEEAEQIGLSMAKKWIDEGKPPA
jgi:hypothetical protein